MAEMPTCTKCGQPHWRFASCDQAPALAKKEREHAQTRERLKVRPEYSAPPGYVRVGPNKFARIDKNAPTPRYIQIAPGKYRKAS